MLKNNKNNQNFISQQDFEKKKKHNEYQRAYYRKNHDKMTKYYQDYREKNREKIREAVRKYKKKKKLLMHELKEKN